MSEYQAFNISNVVKYYHGGRHRPHLMRTPLRFIDSFAGAPHHFSVGGYWNYGFIFYAGRWVFWW